LLRACAGSGSVGGGILGNCFVITNPAGQKVLGQVQYTTTVNTRERTTVVCHAAIVIDASMSMGQSAGKAGLTRMQVVLAHVQQTLRDVLRPTDRVTVAFFHKQYHQVRRCHGCVRCATAHPPHFDCVPCRDDWPVVVCQRLPRVVPLTCHGSPEQTQAQRTPVSPRLEGHKGSEL
jgi:hypothetical protein